MSYIIHHNYIMDLILYLPPMYIYHQFRGILMWMQRSTTGYTDILYPTWWGICGGYAGDVDVSYKPYSMR